MPSANGMDSKDHVEHVRTVHFTLVSLTLGVLALGTARLPSTTENALRQFEEIQEYQRRWDWTALRTLAARSIANKTGRRPAGPLKDASSGLPVDRQCFEVVGPSGKWLLSLNSRGNWLALEPRESSGFSGFVETAVDTMARVGGFELWAAPASLAQFRELWDGWADPLDVALIEGMAMDRATIHSFQAVDREEQEVTYPIAFTKVQSGRCADGETLEREATLMRIRRSPSLTLGGRAGPDPLGHVEVGQLWPSEPAELSLDVGLMTVTDRLRVPVRFSRVHGAFDGQALLREAAARSWPSGRFDRTFSDLAEVTGDYQDAPFDTIGRILLSEVRRNAQALEVAGVRLAGVHVAWLGSIMLVATQLYLFVHMQALAIRLRDRPEDPGRNVAWIGVYGTRVASLMLVLSAFAFPVTVECWLNWRALSARPLDAVLATATTVLGVFLAVMSFRAGREISPGPVAPK